MLQRAVMLESPARAVQHVCTDTRPIAALFHPPDAEGLEYWSLDLPKAATERRKYTNLSPTGSVGH
ncbi:hypothetical protein PC116_g5490 [Phytophthora cactorum]|nr:hypothetical protein PC116_g5490 [Phytophthora cactorum]